MNCENCGVSYNIEDTECRGCGVDLPEVDIQEIRTKENDEIVLKNCNLIWESILNDTKEFNDRRRFIIFSRVTAYMVANVYIPAVEMANDASQVKDDEKQNRKKEI